MTRPSAQDLTERGKAARRYAPLRSRGLGTGPGPTRSRRAARGAERGPGGLAGAGPPRPDVGVPLLVLPGSGPCHGLRSRRHADVGLEVQLGGDAHLANFGTYASPERRLVFDQNDFDETLPGPFEWDVARLAASLWSRPSTSASPGGARVHRRRVAVQSYRLGVSGLADRGALEVWYDHVDVDGMRRRQRPRTAKKLDKAGPVPSGPRGRPAAGRQEVRPTTSRAFRIRSAPPVLFPSPRRPARRRDLRALEAAVTEGARGLTQRRSTIVTCCSRATPRSTSG